MFLFFLLWFQRPTDAKIRVLSASRDALPENRQISALELTYSFSKSKAGEVIPDFCLTSSLLYENSYESQLWMLYDSNKQLLRSGDAYAQQVRGLISVLTFDSCHLLRRVWKILFYIVLQVNLLVSVFDSFSLNVYDLASYIIAHNLDGQVFIQHVIGRAKWRPKSILTHYS